MIITETGLRFLEKYDKYLTRIILMEPVELRFNYNSSIVGYYDTWYFDRLTGAVTVVHVVMFVILATEKNLCLLTYLPAPPFLNPTQKTPASRLFYGRSGLEWPLTSAAVGLHRCEPFEHVSRWINLSPTRQMPGLLPPLQTVCILIDIPSQRWLPLPAQGISRDRGFTPVGDMAQRERSGIKKRRRECNQNGRHKNSSTEVGSDCKGKGKG